MKLSLTNIDSKQVIDIVNSKSIKATPILYVDFNVINTLYEQGICLSSSALPILYYDSLAVYISLKYYYNKFVKKQVSTDILNELIERLNESSNSIFLFGDTQKCLFDASKMITSNLNKIKVQGTYNGYNYNTENIIKLVNENKVDVLFVGLGVGRQEKWIFENYLYLNVKVIISVGGWFQFISHNKKRAPLSFRKLNLEWLYKLIVEFRRVWKRYIFGIPKFYYRLITKKIVLHYEEQ